MALAPGHRSLSQNVPDQLQNAQADQGGYGDQDYEGSCADPADLLTSQHSYLPLQSYPEWSVRLLPRGQSPTS